jgi:hypothetical protein
MTPVHATLYPSRHPSLPCGGTQSSTPLSTGTCTSLGGTLLLPGGDITEGGEAADWVRWGVDLFLLLQGASSSFTSISPRSALRLLPGLFFLGVDDDDDAEVDLAGGSAAAAEESEPPKNALAPPATYGHKAQRKTEIN